MWNKIYLIILAAAIILSGILTFLAHDKLQSTGFAPATIVENYNYYANLNSMVLWISTIVLLIAANVVLWKLRKSWALWTTLVYFAAFTVLQTFWLGQSFFQFKKDNNLSSDVLSFSPFFGIATIILMAIIVFFNQYLVKRLHDKMYLPEQSVDELPADIPIDENRV